MLGKEDFLVIEALARRGVYLCDIARQLGLHPRTVRRALVRGGAPGGGSRRRGSKLDPFKGRVDELLQQKVWNAVVILRELEALGYRGGISILKDYIRPKRVLREGRATVRFETEPGRQLQVDWGNLDVQVGGQEVEVHFLVSTLGYSRRFHFWATDSEDAEHTYEGVIRAFEHFGGVPREVLVDNQRCAVLVPRSGRGRAAQFHPRFLDLAGHYGFLPRDCRVGRARTKGKDERMVGYVKHHFFVRYREFESLEHLNELARQWLASEADRRLHGTVHEVVSERFAREAPALGPLPGKRYDTSYWESRQVGWDAYVEVRGNRYSVPAHLAGQRVGVRISLEGVLSVYEKERLVARHRLQPASTGWVTVPEHHTPLWERLEVERRPLRAYEEAAQWS